MIKEASQLKRMHQKLIQMPIQVPLRYITQTGCMLVRGFCCIEDVLPLPKLDRGG